MQHQAKHKARAHQTEFLTKHQLEKRQTREKPRIWLQWVQCQAKYQNPPRRGPRVLIGFTSVAKTCALITFPEQREATNAENWDRPVLRQGRLHTDETPLQDEVWEGGNWRRSRRSLTYFSKSQNFTRANIVIIIRLFWWKLFEFVNLF